MEWRRLMRMNRSTCQTHSMEDDMKREDEGLVCECSVVLRHRKNRDNDTGSRGACSIVNRAPR